MAGGRWVSRQDTHLRRHGWRRPRFREGGRPGDAAAGRQSRPHDPNAIGRHAARRVGAGGHDGRRTATEGGPHQMEDTASPRSGMDCRLLALYIILPPFLFFYCGPRIRIAAYISSCRTDAASAGRGPTAAVLRGAAPARPPAGGAALRHGQQDKGPGRRPSRREGAGLAGRTG